MVNQSFEADGCTSILDFSWKSQLSERLIGPNQLRERQGSVRSTQFDLVLPPFS